MPEMTTYERAVQIYQVLISAAHMRQTITYEMLGKLIGVPQQGLGPHLAHIWSYCKQNNLPFITALVVYKGQGIPGTGFSTSDNANVDREKVYEHKWYRMKPLTTIDFQNASREA